MKHHDIHSWMLGLQRFKVCGIGWVNMESNMNMCLILARFCGFFCINIVLWLYSFIVKDRWSESGKGCDFEYRLMNVCFA